MSWCSRRYQNSYNSYLHNTDTSVIHTLESVPLMSVCWRPFVSFHKHCLLQRRNWFIRHISLASLNVFKTQKNWKFAVNNNNHTDKKQYTLHWEVSGLKEEHSAEMCPMRPMKWGLIIRLGKTSTRSRVAFLGCESTYSPVPNYHLLHFSCIKVIMQSNTPDATEKRCYRRQPF